MWGGTNSNCEKCCLHGIPEGWTWNERMFRFNCSKCEADSRNELQEDGFDRGSIAHSSSWIIVIGSVVFVLWSIKEGMLYFEYWLEELDD